MKNSVKAFVGGLLLFVLAMMCLGLLKYGADHGWPGYGFMAFPAVAAGFGMALLMGCEFHD